MAIHWSVIRNMDALGMFTRGGAVLDIGTSNLYGADALDIIDFVQRYDGNWARDEAWAISLATRSGRQEDGNALNEAFVGELLEAAGMSYQSIDIAASYKTTILDLNRSKMPDTLVGRNDLVINCGTTEHILNQLNAFDAIHEAAKVGGLMYHQLPAAGFTAHGYFCYTGKFFLDLAAYNNYELVDFWFDGPAGDDPLIEAVANYASHFPRIDSYVRNRQDEREIRIDAVRVPNMSVNVLLRRTTPGPFRGTLDTSTSVGSISNELLASYNRSLTTRVLRKAERIGLSIVNRLFKQ